MTEVQLFKTDLEHCVRCGGRGRVLKYVEHLDEEMPVKCPYCWGSGKTSENPPGRLTGATFSDCRVWRYKLWREWDYENKKGIAFIGLNPSTADETLNDPTITRCIQFAKDWGFGSFVMLNLFGLRSTDPNGLKGVADPVGPENDKYIDLMIEQGRTIVAAWGSHKCVEKLIVPRAAQVLKRIPKPLCLGTNADGMPKHPLYLKKTTNLIPYER